jgi:(p)ppGpp synthase/HD superfamily hydrolase
MDRIDKAVMYAAQAHSGQKRKNNITPYIFHPCEAAMIASFMTEDEDVLIAVLLHDTVEDTDVTLDDIRREFGDHVAELVAGETEDKMQEMSASDSWMIRKQRSLEHLRTAGRDVKIMWLADKVSNIRSFSDLFYKEGPAMWTRFNMRDVKQQEWYYRTIADYVADELGDTIAYREFIWRINTIFGEE